MNQNAQDLIQAICSRVHPALFILFRRRSSQAGAGRSPDPPDLIGVDDFVRGDDSQSKALGLANEHAVEGIAMVFGVFLQEAAIVDVWR